MSTEIDTDPEITGYHWTPFWLRGTLRIMTDPSNPPPLDSSLAALSARIDLLHHAVVKLVTVLDGAAFAASVQAHTAVLAHLHSACEHSAARLSRINEPASAELPPELSALLEYLGSQQQT